jgi:hypothetical protein
MRIMIYDDGFVLCFGSTVCLSFESRYSVWWMLGGLGNLVIELSGFC